jgi:hypothetical protein
VVHVPSQSAYVFLEMIEHSLDKATSLLRTMGGTGAILNDSFFYLHYAYSEKESSLGSGRDDGASLAGKESAIVLSNIFSRFAFELVGSTTRSSGSLLGVIFNVRR